MILLSVSVHVHFKKPQTHYDLYVTVIYVLDHVISAQEEQSPLFQSQECCAGFGKVYIRVLEVVEELGPITNEWACCNN